MKTVKHAQRYHKGHRGHSHSYHRNATDDIDGVSRLLGKKVTTGYVKREIHSNLLFDDLLIDLGRFDL